MTDIDRALARLRELPVHPGLSAIDGAVLEGLMARASGSRPLSGRVFGIAALAALTFGIASSVLPSTSVRTASFAPLGTPPELAPSSLLGTEG